KSDTLIPMLVSDREIVPGYEQWHAAVCGECPGACGTIARVMEGERIIERHGEKFRERIACIKKIEGNPLDPVSGGRLCARGQAAVQSLYNPDRVEGPMRRSGARGRGEFKTAGWDEALDATAQALGKVRSSDPAKILFLTGAQAGSRALTIQRFLAALGAPAARTCSLASLALERKAGEEVFGGRECRVTIWPARVTLWASEWISWAVGLRRSTMPGSSGISARAVQGCGAGWYMPNREC